MKRARLSLEVDLREKEADEILRAQIINEEEAELRQQEAQRQQRAVNAELRHRMQKWDKLGLVSAAGATISPPPPNPTQGPFFLSILPHCVCLR